MFTKIVFIGACLFGLAQAGVEYNLGAGLGGGLGYGGLGYSGLGYGGLGYGGLGYGGLGYGGYGGLGAQATSHVHRVDYNTGYGGLGAGYGGYGAGYGGYGRGLHGYGGW